MDTRDTLNNLSSEGAIDRVIADAAFDDTNEGLGLAMPDETSERNDNTAPSAPTSTAGTTAGKQGKSKQGKKGADKSAGRTPEEGPSSAPKKKGPKPKGDTPEQKKATAEFVSTFQPEFNEALRKGLEERFSVAKKVAEGARDLSRYGRGFVTGLSAAMHVSVATLYREIGVGEAFMTSPEVFTYIREWCEAESIPLTWSHYVQLASAPEGQRDALREDFLKNGWSLEELQKKVREARRQSKPRKERTATAATRLKQATVACEKFVQCFGELEKVVPKGQRLEVEIDASVPVRSLTEVAATASRVGNLLKRITVVQKQKA